MNVSRFKRHVVIWGCLCLTALTTVCFFHLLTAFCAILKGETNDVTFAFQIMVTKQLALLDLAVLILLSVLVVICLTFLWRIVRSDGG